MVRVEDCRAGTAGAMPPPHMKCFFPLKFKRLAV